MNSLEISEDRAKQFDKLEESAINIIQDYFDDKRSGGDDVVTARCMLSVIKGNRQTMTAKEALRFNMASSVSSEAQLKRYVSATCPQIKKLLK